MGTKFTTGGISYYPKSFYPPKSTKNATLSNKKNLFTTVDKMLNHFLKQILNIKRSENKPQLKCHVEILLWLQN